MSFSLIDKRSKRDVKPVSTPPPRSFHQRIVRKLASGIATLFLGIGLVVGGAVAPDFLSSGAVQEAEAAQLSSRYLVPYHSSSHCYNSINSKGFRAYYTNYFVVDGNIAYCLQPKNGTPSFGNHNKNYQNNTALATVMYFGYGGPGFNYAVQQGWWPSRNCDGNAMTTNDYYVATHVMVSYLYGSDALFGTCTRYRNWANSQLFGWVLPNMRNQAWQVPEPAKKSAFVLYTAWNKQDIISFDWVSAGGLKILKVDGHTNRPLSGIKFDVHYSDQAGHIGSKITSITTDTSGNAATRINELPVGWYVLKELNPPSGYDPVVTEPIKVCDNFLYAFQLQRTGSSKYARYVVDNYAYKEIHWTKKYIGYITPKLTLVLYQNGKEYSRHSFNTNSNYYGYSGYWKNLPKFDSNGKEYNYTIRELGENNGALSTNGHNYNVYYIGNNIYNIENEDFTVVKEWNDFDNQYQLRPKTIKVKLTRLNTTTGESNIVSTVTLSEENNWQYTWHQLPKGNTANNKYSYSVEEEKDGITSRLYETRLENSNKIINKLRTIDVPVQKIWVGNNTRPSSIVLKLMNGSSEVARQIVAPDEKGQWSYTFANVPMYDLNGNENKYTVEEEPVPGYSAINGTMITEEGIKGIQIKNISTETTRVPVNKIWDETAGNARPSCITVNLIANGMATGKTLILDASNNWKGAFENVPKYDQITGSEILYTVTEVPVSQYAWDIAGDMQNGYTITNTFGVTSLTITKTWNDNNNANNRRPSSVIFHIFADGEDINQNITLNAANGWKFTKTNLPKYNIQGNEIVYSIKEESVAFYATSINGDHMNGFTVTNRYAENETSVPVRKIWNDKENEAGFRPSDVLVTLKKQVPNGVQKILPQSGSVNVPKIINVSDSEIYIRVAYANGTAADYTASANYSMPFMINNKLTSSQYFEDWTISQTGTKFNNSLQLLNNYGVAKLDLSNNNSFALFAALDRPSSAITRPYFFTLSGIKYSSYNTASLQWKRWNGLAYAPGTDGQYPDVLYIDSNNNGYIGYDYTYSKDVYDWGTIFGITPKGTGKNYSTNTFARVITADSQWSNGGQANISFLAQGTASQTSSGKAAHKVTLLIPTSGQYYYPTAIANARHALSFYYTASSTQQVTVKMQTQTGYWNEGDVFATFTAQPGTHYYTLTQNATNAKSGKVRLDFLDASGTNLNGNVTDLSFWNTAAGTTTSDTGKTLVLSADNNWTGSFEGLPRFDTTTYAPIGYIVEEQPVDNYTGSVSNTGKAPNYSTANALTQNPYYSYNLTNTLGDIRDIPVEKVWNDYDDKMGYRPDQVVVSLLADGAATGKTATLSQANGWKSTFSNLPSKNSSGSYIQYTVSEERASRYEQPQITGSMDSGYIIANNLTLVSIPVEKIWNDLDNAYNSRASSVTVHLLANGSDTGKQIILSDVNDWSASFDDLPVLTEDNQSIAYTVIEDEVQNYTTSISNANGIYTIENSLSKLSVPVQKIWSNTAGHMPPDSIVVELFRNGEKAGEATLFADNEWKHTFDNLDVFDSNGEPYAYTVDEKAFDGSDRYMKSITGNAIDGYVITNTENIDIPVYKTWNDSNNSDGIRPSSVTVRLLVNGAESEDRAPLVLNAQNDWNGTFENLSRYDEDGKAIKYTVSEDIVLDYETEIAGSDATGFTIENTHKVRWTSLDVRKTWDDGDNQDNIRPSSVIITLLRNGVECDKAELSEENAWEYTFTRLDLVDENGGFYKYEVIEADGDIPEGYESSVSRSEDGMYIVTNTHAPKTIDIPVEKTWMSGVPADEIPDSVTVRLLRNGEEIDSAEIRPNEAGAWRHVFEGMEISDAQGNAYEYSVTEDPIPHFHGDIIGSAEDGFQINNQYTLAKVTIPVVKQWEGDEEANRPPSITVNLLRDEEIIDTVQLTRNADGSWSHEFTDLEFLAPDGHEYQYSVTEEPIDGYETEYGYTRDGDYLILNRKTLEIPVQKTWNDDNNKNGSRPSSINVNLHASRYLNAADLVYDKDKGIFNFTAQPSFFDSEITFDGTVRQAKVQVLSADKTVLSEHELAPNGLAVPIAFEIGSIPERDCSIKVVDADGDDIGEHVGKLVIMDDARYTYLIASKTLLAGNDWKAVFTGLKECDNRGFPIEYSVSEETVLGYEATYGKAPDGTLTIENTEVAGIDVEKIWDTDENAELPESITVHLLQNGSRYKELVLDSSTNWRGRFENVSWRDENGKVYDYAIEEDDVVGFEGRVAFDVYGYKATITNVPTTQVDVEKVWEGDELHVDERPTSITATLARATSESVMLGQSDAISSWNDVLSSAYAADTALHGTPVKMSYQFANESDRDLVIKLTATRGSTAYDTYIAIASNNTVDGVLPLSDMPVASNTRWTFASPNEWDESLEQAIADGEVRGTVMMEFSEQVTSSQVRAENEWKASFVELPTKDARSNVYSYSVSESGVPEGYVSHVESADGRYVITNTYGKIDIPVEKTWVDLDDRDKMRPESVEIELIANGEPTGNRLVLSDACDWKGAFTKLDPYDENGETIVYEVRENNIPDGYNCNISGDAERGFTVDNSHDCKTGIKVTKVWDDDQDALRKRPMSITVHLFGDGEEVASGKIQGSGDVWEMVFQDLPYVNKDGHVIEYTVSEEAVDGYTMTNLTGNGEDGYIITNWTEQPEYTLPLSGSSSLAIMTFIGGVLLIILGIVSTRRMRIENKAMKELKRRLESRSNDD